MTIGMFDLMIAYMPLVRKWSQDKDVAAELMGINAQLDASYRVAFGGSFSTNDSNEETDELF